MRATARAPCRIDFAGGTLDIWPLGLLHPGARTVNLAVDVQVRAELVPSDRIYRVVQGGSTAEAATPQELARDPEGALAGVVADELGLPPVEIRLESDSPRGGGLGASSAAAVALIAAAEELLERPRSTPSSRAALARDLEARLMALPTGTQDHYPALLGGALEILHRPGGEAVRRLEADLDALAASLLVVFSGSSHLSAASNWRVVRRRLDGDRESVELFSGISEVAAELSSALEAGDLPRVGELMAQEWALRRRLARGVSTPLLEQLLEEGRALGAWGGKACGAGGGGCLALLCPPDRKQAIAERLTAAGATEVAARPTAAGVHSERF